MRARDRLLYLALALAILAAAALALRLGWFDPETAPVRLPETTASLPDGPGSGNAGGLVTAAVTADTVQAVVSTLARPDSYSRSLRVESFWEGGSRAWEVSVRQKGSAQRIRILPEDGAGPEKNILCRDGEVLLWYDDPEEAFRCPLEDPAAADALQMIPTYEDLLALDPGQIQSAGYVLREGAWRIMASVREEPTGYVMAYYISIDTGLLEAAERWDGDRLIYSMTAGQAELAAPEDEFFDPAAEDGEEPVTD